MSEDIMSTLIGGGLAAFFTGLFTWFAAKAQSKSQVESARVETSGPQWKQFSDTIMQRLNEQQEELDGLKAELAKIREKFENTNRKYWQAVLSLRRVFQHHPEVVEVAELPAEVHDDVFEG